MKILEILEKNDDLILYSLEKNDIVIFPFIDSHSVVSFIQKTYGTTFLFISHSDTIHNVKIDGIPYQRTVYDSRFNLNSNSCITYDLAVFLISENIECFKVFDFIVLDEVDVRSAESDLFLGLLLNLGFKGKLIIPLKSNFNLEVYDFYFRSFNYEVEIIDLISRPRIKVFTVDKVLKPELMYQTIHQTINQIFKEHNKSEAYDILVVFEHEFQIKDLVSYLKDYPLSDNYSIITEISDTQLKRSTRRLFIQRETYQIAKVNHRLNHIINCGSDKTKVHDTNLLPLNISKPINRNTLESQLALLSEESASYYCLFPLKQIHTFEYGILNSHFIPHLLYVLKSGLRLKDIRFLKPPSQEQLQRCISYLVYLGLVDVLGSEVLLSGMGKEITKFQFSLNIESMSLFLFLVQPNKTGLEALKITSLLTNLDWNRLSIYFKESKVKSLLHDDNDFITLVNIYDSIIIYDTCKPNNTTTTFNDFFGKDSKQRILDSTRKLRSILRRKINIDRASDDQMDQAILKAFQLHTGSIQINPNEKNEQYVNVTVKPTIDFTLNQEAKIQLLIKKLPIEEASNYRNGEIVVFSNCEYLFNQAVTKKYQETNTSDDTNTDQSRDMVNYYLKFVAKLNKKVVNDSDIVLLKLE